ncbi:thioredoxin family protein [Bdellovibrio sp. KM01]|uniref:thioredoxin family protein n=1 Tax=Bdellovibrio sp. KM01 TaxID=2748865 RepID=UPI0015E9F28A|nr:thioredoxin family protein [Bdellovibrio sp. KM01]QLY24130.1 thioredoxin fold domain-containing protein [Bdellovibrio sp. KM01]
MKTIVLALSLLVVCSFSFARLSDGKAHLKLKGSQIVASVDDGFHFNKDAPAALVMGEESIDAVKKDAKEFVFDATKAQKKTFTVNYYVCDDKNTVCEAHEEKFQITNGKLVAPSGATATVAAKAASDAKVVEAPLKKNKHGFYEDSFHAALKLAAKEKKLLLVDFNAPWCPSCIRLESEAFGEPEFIQATEKFIKLSLNVDKPALKDISKKYGIKGIPTMIVMNAKGEELTRILDFKPAPVLAKEIAIFQASNKATLTELRKKADAGDLDARKVLADQSYAALKFEDVVKWLVPTGEQSLLLANSEIRVAESAFDKDKKNAADYKKTFEKWIAIFPHSIDAIEWRPDLMKLMKGESKEVSAEVKKIGAENIAEIQNLLGNEKARAETFAVNKFGDMTGFEKAELLSQQVETYKLMNETKKSEESAAVLAKEVATFDLSVERPGQVLVALPYIKAANMKKDAQEWLEKLLKANPDSDVYLMKLVGFHMREKQFTQALPYAEKVAVMKSDSALYYQRILADVLKELKQKEKAMDVINKALAMPEAKLESNKSVVTGLQDLKKSL